MESQPIKVAESGSETVLSYAKQQQRWERGVAWLVGIVCVSQLLTLPSGVCEWGVCIKEIIRGIPGWGIRWKVLAGLNMLRPVLALALVTCAFLVLMGVRRARVLLKLFAWAMIVFVFVRALTIMVNSSWDSGSFDFSKTRGQFLYDFFGEVEMLFLLCYPVVLLNATLKRGHSAQKGWGAAMIWWVTAAACIFVAAPTCYDWVSDFHAQWISATGEVFAAHIEGDWWTTFRGIGQISHAMGCFSAVAATVWTAFLGIGGRWSLMICAALWVVSAAGIYGMDAVHGIYDLLEDGSFRSMSFIDMAREFIPTAESLRWFSVTMAFALAVRVALSLADVREKLDRKADGAG